MIKSYILFYLVIFPIVSFTQSFNEPISNPKNYNNQTCEFYLPDPGLNGYILSIEDLSNSKKKDDQWLGGYSLFLKSPIHIFEGTSSFESNLPDLMYWISK